MVKNMKRFALLLCVLVLCVSTLATVAFAAEPATVRIPAQVVLGGDLPEETEIFVVQLVPANASDPMPAGAENGVYTTEIAGEDSAVIEIAFEDAGVYGYTLIQLSGDNEDCTYSADAYDVTVFVTNSDNGGLDVSVVAYKQGADEKSEILFYNEYAEYEEPEYPGRPDRPHRPERPDGPEEPEEEIPETTVPPIESPATGDNSQIVVFAALMAVSAVGIVALLVLMKRQKKEEN